MFLRLILFLTLPVVGCAQAEVSWKSSLRQEVTQRTNDHRFVDGAFGVVTQHSQDFITFGVATTDTIFEIGSITKSFTGIIFAEMVNEKILSPSDRVEKFVPDLKGTFAGQIKLSELATHTSGLPSIPSDLPMNNNPYADYSWTRLISSLKNTTPTLARPYRVHYSNIGFALLGQILAIVDNVNYSTLVKNRITQPLKMNDTELVVGFYKWNRFIEGYSLDTTMGPVSHWDFDAFSPTGAIRSTLHDMLIFAQANLYPDATPLGKAMQLSLSHLWGWDSQILKLPYIYKNGATGGFRSGLMISPSHDLAVIQLTNIALGDDCLMFQFLKHGFNVDSGATANSCYKSNY